MAGDGGQLSGADAAELGDAELGELAALADGSLPPADRARVAARVERSAALRALVAEQRAALAAVELIDASAPAGLRARLEGERRVAGSRARPPRLALVGGLAVAVAVLAVVLVTGSGTGSPSIDQVADQAPRGATEPAPPADRADRNLLAASVAGVPFPNFAAMFGWRASGERGDDLDGRDTRTVYDERGGREIAYSIVSGEALEWPAGARLSTRDGIELRSLERAGSTVVTWLRDGRTCVLSGAGIPRDELLDLAAWTGDGSVSF